MPCEQFTTPAKSQYCFKNSLKNLSCTRIRVCQLDRDLYHSRKSLDIDRALLFHYSCLRLHQVFQLVDKIKSAASHVKEQCASVQGGGGSIVIQRRSTKERGQVVQTAACKHGFQSGFATLLVTQQRLHGLDRLNVPVKEGKKKAGVLVLTFSSHLSLGFLTLIAFLFDTVSFALLFCCLPRWPITNITSWKTRGVSVSFTGTISVCLFLTLRCLVHFPSFVTSPLKSSLLLGSACVKGGEEQTLPHQQLPNATPFTETILKSWTLAQRNCNRNGAMN